MHLMQNTFHHDVEGAFKSIVQFQTNYHNYYTNMVS